MTKLKIITIVLLTLLYSCQIQKENQRREEIRSEVLALRDSIAQINELHYQYIGYAGATSDQYKNYKKLSQTATNKELYILAKDYNPVVATYATFALMDKGDTSYRSIFQHFLEDDRAISIKSGCFDTSSSVSSEIYYEYIRQSNEIMSKPGNRYMKLQKDLTLLKLDSLIMVSEHENWELYETMFKNLNFDKELLPLIERLAFTKKNILAIEYLSKNHENVYKKQIKKILMSYLYNSKTPIKTYRKAFLILLSFNEADINSVLVRKLDDIKRIYGQNKMYEFQGILQAYNVGF